MHKLDVLFPASLTHLFQLCYNCWSCITITHSLTSLQMKTFSFFCGIQSIWDATATDTTRYKVTSKSLNLQALSHMWDPPVKLLQLWTHVRKWGWFFTVSSSFSKNVVSVASPGLRHSSSWKKTKTICILVLISLCACKHMVQLQFCLTKTHSQLNPLAF